MARLTVYPDSGYNSFISHKDAFRYFRTRLNTEAWDSGDQITALLQAYRSLQELDIVVDLTNTTALQALATAQCEQAYHELRHDLEELQASSVSLGGILSVKLKDDKRERPPRHSPRAIAILRPYLRVNTITRIR